MRQPNEMASRQGARYVASSGMALALCLITLLLFRGLFSLLQALIIPVIILLLTARQPWPYTLATSLSLVALTLVFFPTQAVFVLTYLWMALILMKMGPLILGGARRRYLLIVPYLVLISVLLFLGIQATDFVFQTQLHAMMRRLSGRDNLRYAAIMMLEAALVSISHLLFIASIRRRQKQEKSTPIGSVQDIQ
jgi:hypothetical protein